MNGTIIKECNAKLNLAIDVTNRLPNGYHIVRMIMIRVGLSDRVTISLRDDGAVWLTGSGKDMPLDEKNLAYRAAKAFFSEVKISNVGCDIHIEKHIPAGAGMAGGSADAAGVINGLNELLGEPLDLSKRLKLGITLGADIPFCTHGGCALAEGIGEKLTPLKEPPKARYLIAKPKQSVSTKWVYEHLDFSKKPDGLNVDLCKRGIENGDFEMMLSGMGNVLENATLPICPDVTVYKNDMLKLGADISLMSGSGSAVFGIYRDEDAAKTAYDEFRSLHCDADGVWLV